MKRWSVLAALGCSFFCARANAQAPSGSDAATVATAVAPPTEWGAVRAAFGYPGFAGLAVSLGLIPHVEVEAGWDDVIRGGFDFGPGWFLQAGPRFWLADTRGPGGRGVTLALAPAMGGARLWQDPSLIGTEVAVMLTASFEATYWLMPHIGLQLAFSGGADFWIATPPNHEPSTDVAFRAALGLAF